MTNQFTGQAVDVDAFEIVKLLTAEIENCLTVHYMPTWMPSLLNMLPLMTGLLVRRSHRERCAHRPAIAREIEPPELHNLPTRLSNRPHEIHQQRISVELINLTFLRTGGTPDEYRAGLDRAIAKSWLIRHMSGSHVKFTQAGADLVRLISKPCPLSGCRLNRSTQHRR
jgi:hypothetical protein